MGLGLLINNNYTFSYILGAFGKINGIAPLVEDPTPPNSTTDADTHPISHGQPLVLWTTEETSSLGNIHLFVIPQLT